MSIQGTPIILAPAIPDGTVIRGMDPAPGRDSTVIFIGTAPLTDLQLAKKEIRHQVRTGLADVLAWLGQEVGDPPQRTGAGIAMYEALRTRVDVGDPHPGANFPIHHTIGLANRDAPLFPAQPPADPLGDLLRARAWFAQQTHPPRYLP